MCVCLAVSLFLKKQFHQPQYTTTTTNACCETPFPNIDWPQRFLMSWLLPLVHYCPIRNSLPPSFPGSHVACHCQTTPVQGPPQYSVSIVPSPLPLVHMYCFVIKTLPDYFARHHHHPCAAHFLTCYVQELSSLGYKPLKSHIPLGFKDLTHMKTLILGLAHLNRTYK